MAKRIPYKVYQDIVARKKRGDPSVNSQYNWVEKAIQSGELTVEPPPYGVMDTLAGTLMDESLMGLADLPHDSQGRENALYRGQEENPTVAGVAGLLPYLAGGAGAVKGMVTKHMTGVKKKLADVLFPPAPAASKLGPEAVQGIKEGGEFAIDLRKTSPSDPIWDAIQQGSRKHTQPPGGGRRSLGEADVKAELQRHLDAPQESLLHADRSPQVSPTAKTVVSPVPRSNPELPMRNVSEYRKQSLINKILKEKGSISAEELHAIESLF